MGLEIVIVLMVLMAAALFVLPPLLRNEPDAKARPEDRRKELARAVSRRDVIYEALTDLEQDYTAGKLSDADYTHMKRGYQKEAIAALRELDALEPENLEAVVDRNRKSSP